MAIVNEHNIARSAFFMIIVVISLIIFGVGAYFVVTRHEVAARQLDRLEAQLIGQQEVDLKKDVENLLHRIESLNRGLQEQITTQTDAADNNQTNADAETAGTYSRDEELRQLVLDRLGNAEDLADGNYFIYELHELKGGDGFATMLFNPGRPDLEGQLLSTDFPDAKGHDFRKVFMKDIRDRGESFVIYWYNKNGSGEGEGPDPGRKLAYFAYDPDWSWIVAKSVYLDPIDNLIAGLRAERKRTLGLDLVFLGIIFTGSVVLALFLAYSFSLSIHTLLKRYQDAEQLHQIEVENLTKTLEQQNRRDRLTSAYNRAFFSDELGKEKERSDRYRTPLSMILFDIDHFRSINDRLGSTAGDMMLQEMVELVKDNIRKSDVFARWAGEEFAVLAPGLELDQGRQFAEKLCTLIEENNYSTGASITCSFGISNYQAPESLESFVQRTDTALHEAKKGGRNRCVALTA
jgi:diguanylate cyclase (GGDEF)-like protein